MHVIRSLLFYLAFYFGSIFYVLASLVMRPISDSAFRKICDAWSGFHLWCVETILGIKMVVTGNQPKGAVFFAIKHEAFFEAIEILHLFDNPAGFAKQELFEIPGWGRTARNYGAIPVIRDDGAKALRTMLKQVRPYIAEGRPIIIFPEGRRVKHGTRPPLQAGFAALYKLLDIPVVPVAVNSGPAYHTKWKRPGTINVHFGEPIPPGLPREEVEARTHAAINALNTPVED